MATKIQRLTIFVSGPSDVDSEKSALRTVVTNLSDRLERTVGVALKVVGWPDDVRPGVNVDPQAEVTRQFGTDFDIYLGILSTRFGTSTPRANSGTEEEFNKAVARFQADSSSVRVLFYFKGSTQNILKVDADELKKVQKFRVDLSQRGVVYRDFKETSDFVAMVQRHLDELITEEWKDGHWSTIREVELDDDQAAESSLTLSTDHHPDLGQMTNALCAADDEDDSGLLDYMDSFHKEANALNQTLEQLSEDTIRIGNEMNSRTGEINTLYREHEKVKHIGGSKAQQEFVAQSRRNVDQAAENLDDFSRSMIVNVEAYRVHSRAMFSHLRDGVNETQELGNTGNTEDLAALETLVKGLIEGISVISKFQAAIAKVPALTGKFKRARRRTAAILGELIAEFSLTINEARKVQKTLGATAAKGPS